MIITPTGKIFLNNAGSAQGEWMVESGCVTETSEGYSMTIDLYRPKEIHGYGQKCAPQGNQKRTRQRVKKGNRK